MIDEQRITTMTERLGDAAELIDDKRYLPMFRNRQMHYKELFDFSVKLAKTKKNPSRYFAALWGAKTLSKTLDWLQKLVNATKSKAAEFIREQKQKHEDRKAQKALENPMNRETRRRYEKMLRSSRLLDGSAPAPV